MLTVQIDNCNNITSGNINIIKNNLNIFYAMNGMGKSTIAKAIALTAENGDLSTLRPFGDNVIPAGSFSQPVGKVLLFDEDFVNTIVFNESEVIENAFDVFIKTPQYEESLRSINERLKNLHIDTSTNQDLTKLLSAGQLVLTKFTLTKSNELKQIGLIKSLTNSESIFHLPEKIKKFQPLMIKEYNVDWVGWKNDGGKFDDNNICPFCATGLDSEYTNEKKIFTSSYTKSNVKNIREMISYFDTLQEYLDADKKEMLYRCIRETTDEQTINLWVRKFYLELKYLVEKIKRVQEFNTFEVRRDEISKLGDQLTSLTIDIEPLEIFTSDKVKELLASINERILALVGETEILKKDIGELNGLIGSATRRAVQDINEFLYMAGINYVLEIVHAGENVTRSILKYRSRGDDDIPVENIRMHLSWGERNAFALVLFMHYALSQNPDIVILDDPISSFDNNKKYAIINRLFTNVQGKASFFGRTVLMLTHDFQPIIDFIAVHKPTGRSVSGCFLRNDAGVISVTEISENDIKSWPILLSENTKNEALNKVHRVTSLRKLLEHTQMSLEESMAYNILSCLLHGKEKPTFLDGTEINQADIIVGEKVIQEYIADFTYPSYKQGVFDLPVLTDLFKKETNAYFQLQVFRVILAVANIRSEMIDDPLLKYIDEQFHVENDYIFHLDLKKYDIVPEFVIPKCRQFLEQKHLI